MKKLAAFLVALVLFGGTVLGYHLYNKNHLDFENNAFSTWSQDTKSLSRAGICANLNENSLVVFGSSEFQHGNKLPCHPNQLFRQTKLNTLLIGAGYYQSLSHAITLASISDSMENKKAVLLLSPQWFRKTGVVDKAFASRFSETHYLGMLNNSSLSQETKEAIMERTEELLAADPSTLERVESYDRQARGEETGFFENLYLNFYERFLTEKDQAGVVTQARLAGITWHPQQELTEAEPDWNSLLAQAEAYGEKYQQNEFFMDKKSYREAAARKKEKKGSDADAKTGYGSSPEYDDLRIFLSVCQDLDITPMLVILPVNCYWYDFTEFPTQARQKYYQNIRDLAAEFPGTVVTDLSGEEHTKYFFQDSVHLAQKGWLTVDEALYQFAQQN